MIKSKIKNLLGIKKIAEKIDNIVHRSQIHETQLVLSIRQAVEMELSNLLGDDIKHFNINIQSNGMNPGVSISCADDIGKFIYYGTNPHGIYAGGRAMPVGDNKFAARVRHPGQKPKKREIDEAIRRGILIGRSAAGRADYI
jgi:hypothetical protein